MWDPYAEFESAVLPNGLTVHSAHWPGRPWEAVGFLIHSGAEHDPVGLEGLSHFVEHMVSLNTVISRAEIQAFFEDSGGQVSLGTTGHSYTHYDFFVPADEAQLARAFSIFGSMLLSANLEKSIERERKVIIAEFNRDYSMKLQLDLNVREYKALYAGYWLERAASPLGVLESVSRITQEDLQGYYDRHYTPANISVVCVGALQLSELVGLLSDSPFATRKEGVRTPLPVPVTNVALPSETRYIFEVSKHADMPVQTGTYRSVAIIPGHVSEMAVRILSQMLSEVLNEEVREQRAWTYSIYSSSHNFRHFYRFEVHCDALELRALDDIERVVEECISSIGGREELFEQIKRRAIASYLMTDSTGMRVCDAALNDLANYQRIVSLRETVDNIERVTMNDVRSLLRWLQPERRWTLVIRP